MLLQIMELLYDCLCEYGYWLSFMDIMMMTDDKYVVGEDHKKEEKKCEINPVTSSKPQWSRPLKLIRYAQDPP